MGKNKLMPFFIALRVCASAMLWLGVLGVNFYVALAGHEDSFRTAAMRALARVSLAPAVSSISDAGLLTETSTLSHSRDIHTTTVATFCLLFSHSIAC